MKTRFFLASGAIALVIGSSLLFTSAKNPAAPEPVLGNQLELSRSRIYWEYNASANDLGVHVTLDGQNWTRMKIFRPNESLIFDVRGYGPYQNLGMTELFFEGAEPNLDDFPLNDLLALFPEGEYDFEGTTVAGEDIEGESMFSHAIPAGPRVLAQVGSNNLLRIVWSPVTTPPPGFPNRPINISGYQVIVGSFQLTLPPHVTSVTVPPEFVQSLASGPHQFEVLAIEASGNQTLTEGTFVH